MGILNMKARLAAGLLAVLGLLLTAGPTLAAKDQYLGDSSIYAGAPPTMTRPNVLIIVDNSRATLEAAPGIAYEPATVYAPVPNSGQTCAEGESSVQKGCFHPWYVYTIDNQGDIGLQPVLTNTGSDLSNLTCTDSLDVIRETLIQRGTYSGAGNASYPNIATGASLGACDSDAPSGRVYVLGNYLNYTRTASVLTFQEEAPEECSDPNPIVFHSFDEAVCKVGPTCSASNFKRVGQPGCSAAQTDCTITRSGYFQLKATHTAAADTAPGQGANWSVYWNSLGTSGTATHGNWASGTTYTVTLDLEFDDAFGVSHPCSYWANLPEVEETPTQREIMYTAIEQAVSGAVGAVNFGAMVYGLNNSGGTLAFAMADLSAGLQTAIGADGLPSPVVPDCSNAANSGLAFCQYLAALPGLRETSPLPNNFTCTDFNGPDCVASATGRPQAESVFDAGYYFGANYAGITNTTRIADAIRNPCGLNHIILLTNGFTNGDNSPNMAVVGDADSDAYPDEDVYGLGSHWLDDVAKYLQAEYGVTTHAVLAFQERDALVENATKDGGGRFYQAYNAQQLSAALTKLLATIINEKSTSFVAPVVPASTTNRTISSNKVYLGLFRPQAVGEPWRGNVKKYSVSSDSANQLLGADNSAATDAYGTFDRDSISYWSLVGGVVPSARGDINPAGTDANKPKGDGGEVDAGGVGGVLLKRVEGLATEIIAANDWGISSSLWRDIYTYTGTSTTLTHASNSFALGNTALTTATFGVASTTERDTLIRYIHGFENNDTSTPEARSWVLGDVLHSRPQIINYNRYPESAQNVCVESGATDYNDSIIYVGANDGMLHAFRDCNGEELWAFVPPSALGDLKYFMESGTDGHPTFVDGPPSYFVWDADMDGVIESGDRVILVFGMRRGGGKNIIDNTSRGAYYALDVTNPASPVYLWKLDSSVAAELGETWSQPMMAKVRLADDTTDDVTTKTVKQVMFIGAGYDNMEDLRYGDTQTFPTPTGVDLNGLTGAAGTGGTVDGSGSPLTSAGSLSTDDFPSASAARGRGIYAVEIATFSKSGASATSVTVNTSPTIFWSYTHANNPDMNYSFPSDLTVLDMNGNGFTDRIYAGDTGGNLWRFDLSGAPNAWTGEILFTANPGADGTEGRKIFYPPAVAYVGAPFIYFGTGDREHPLNKAVVDRIYCVMDWKDMEVQKGLAMAKSGNYPLTESLLEDVTDNALQVQELSATADSAYLDLKKRLFSTPNAPYDNNGNYIYGWYIKMDGGDRGIGSGGDGEKILAQSEIFSGGVYFNTYRPLSGSAATCEAGNLGVSTAYTVNYRTGEAMYNFDTSNDLTGLNSTEMAATVNERAIGGESGELLQRTDRHRELGSGIPSGAVIIVGADGRVKLIMSSSEKVNVFEGFNTKAVHPIYWMQW